MIGTKRLIELARKWQKKAAGKRKRISYQRSDVDMHSSAANKGHFVVYSIDRKRFMVPLKYLSNNLFRELLKWSEEEFGLTANGPILLPCDSILLDYVISLLQENLPEDVEKALITSLQDTCHGVASSSSLALTQTHQQSIIYGF